MPTRFVLVVLLVVVGADICASQGEDECFYPVPDLRDNAFMKCCVENPKVIRERLDMCNYTTIFTYYKVEGAVKPCDVHPEYTDPPEPETTTQIYTKLPTRPTTTTTTTTSTTAASTTHTVPTPLTYPLPNLTLYFSNNVISRSHLGKHPLRNHALEEDKLPPVTPEHMRAIMSCFSNYKDLQDCCTRNGIDNGCEFMCDQRDDAPEIPNAFNVPEECLYGPKYAMTHVKEDEILTNSIIMMQCFYRYGYSDIFSPSDQ